ncbi:MAG TPA: hypothetical protein VNF72_20365 [Myxococcota bacterium]|nr:hypothetical protein [Myxococcota bacterium]
MTRKRCSLALSLRSAARRAPIVWLIEAISAPKTPSERPPRISA